MFKNELTKKMPCWDCSVSNDKCLILAGISIPVASSHHMKGLTFECSEMVKK